MQLNSAYIHEDNILKSIYIDAVNNFIKEASSNITFNDLCSYVFRKLIQKKQSPYDHSIMIVKEVCQKIGEDFFSAIEHLCPNAKTYRDIYFSIYKS